MTGALLREALKTKVCSFVSENCYIVLSFHFVTFLGFEQAESVFLYSKRVPLENKCQLSNSGSSEMISSVRIQLASR